jgi:hypothetical protein
LSPLEGDYFTLRKLSEYTQGTILRKGSGNSQETHSSDPGFIKIGVVFIYIVTQKITVISHQIPLLTRYFKILQDKVCAFKKCTGYLYM